MKPILLAAACGLSLSACMTAAEAPRADAPRVEAPRAEATAGAEAHAVTTVGGYTSGPTLTADEAFAQASALDGQTVRVAGTIREVCQARGCWLTFSTAQGQTLRVMTHDEGTEDSEAVLFPKDAAGRHAEVLGTLHVAEESVERRRHLAEDGGASAAEVAAITEPTRSVSLLATGARID